MSRNATVIYSIRVSFIFDERLLKGIGVLFSPLKNHLAVVLHPVKKILLNGVLKNHLECQHCFWG